MHRMSEDEQIDFLFQQQRERCAWCPNKLVRELRGRQHRDKKGCWELHHNPPKARLDNAFGGKRLRNRVYPDTPLTLRLLCWECHSKTLGRNRPIDPRDTMR